MATKNALVFVIHKHDATSLHYDFRLEIAGVMPSWAIPKGPTLDNTMKRLAMMTTNHDLSYRTFEGVLAEGSYGAGPVMIWDEGTYTPEVEIAKGADASGVNQKGARLQGTRLKKEHSADRGGQRETVDDRKKGEQIMVEGLKKGEIKFFLHGKKLKGSFALVKTRNFGPKNAWLLIKHNDEYVQKGYNANDYDFSAKSNKSLKQISAKT